MGNFKLRVSFLSIIPLLVIFSVNFAASAKLTTYLKDVTLTQNQVASLEKFKRMVTDSVPVPHEYMKKDIYLLKILRYQNFDLRRAEEMLKEILSWREEHGMDTIHDEDWTDMQRQLMYHLGSRDKMGQPLLYFDVQGMDVRKLVLSGQDKRLLRYVDKVLDEACGSVRKLGEKYQNVTRGNLLINVKGYNLVEVGCLRCIPVLLRMVVAYERHHPECVDNIWAVNTPGIVAPLLEAVRPLLSQGVRNHLNIIGTNKNKILDTLLQHFDISEIPVQLGGKKVYTKKSWEKNDPDYSEEEDTTEKNIGTL